MAKRIKKKRAIDAKYSVSPKTEGGNAPKTEGAGALNSKDAGALNSKDAGASNSKVVAAYKTEGDAVPTTEGDIAPKREAADSPKSESANFSKTANVSTSKAKLAVFDFDGTLIPIQSGAHMSLDMLRSKIMSKRSAARLIFWAFRYKMHLPYKEDVAREIIFGCFEGKPTKEVDKYIDDFSARKVEPIVRKELIETAKDLKAHGYVVLILSAAFDPTLRSFIKDKDFDGFIGTQMEVDENGNYTGNVVGKPCAKKEKIARLKKFADENFGKGNWEISYAFADHYTDKPLLKMAESAVAVSPDDTLERYAKKQGWKIIEFEKEDKKGSK